MRVIPPPPALDSLSAGSRLAAGMGESTVVADLDFETYSEAGYCWNDTRQRWEGPPGAPGTTRGLGVVGAAVYARHPSTEVLSLAFDLKGGSGPDLWAPGDPPPLALLDHVRGGGLLEAWNVGFERWIWECVCTPRFGWPAVRPWQWRCAMAKARASSYPGALGKAGDVLNLTVRKDKDGDRLLKLFSMPRNPTKTDPRRRISPRDAPDEAVRLAEYNATDIASEAEASSLVPDLEGEELAWWQVDQAVNRRGVHVDRASVEDCIAVIEEAHAQYNAELLALTGIDAASKVQQLLGWLHSQGVHLDTLDEDSVAAALAGLALSADCRRVLEIRAAIGSASVKKVFAMRNRMTDEDRMHDLFIYHGARTGRATGEGPQPTNSPKAGPDVVQCGCQRHHRPDASVCPWCHVAVPPGRRTIEWSPEVAEDAFEALRSRSLARVEAVFGDAMGAVSGCIRGLYDAAPGHDLISADFNSIEAVGLAMLAGEAWRIEVFRTHGKIYEKSAAMMYRVPFEAFAQHKAETGQHHPLRQKGKIAELAFGYGGWLGSAAAFGMPGTEAEIKADILAWRAASPSVEWLWGGQTLGKASGPRANAGLVSGYVDRWDETPCYFGVEGAAVQAVLTPGVEHHVFRLDGSRAGVSFVTRGDALYCRLPSGRYLTYHRPRTMRGDRGGLDLSFYGWNSNPKNGAMGWVEMRTWGARLVENINQAACRDILRYAAINLECHGYPIVLHVYDEIVSEAPESFGSIEEFERIMTTTPAWASDWPVRAPGGWRGKRYRKA